MNMQTDVLNLPLCELTLIEERFFGPPEPTPPKYTDSAGAIWRLGTGGPIVTPASSPRRGDPVVYMHQATLYRAIVFAGGHAITEDTSLDDLRTWMCMMNVELSVSDDLYSLATRDGDHMVKVKAPSMVVGIVRACQGMIALLRPDHANSTQPLARAAS